MVIAVAANSDLYVVWPSRGGGGMEPGDITTARFRSSGEHVWTRRYDGPRHRDDWAVAVSVSPDGKVVVAGTQTDAMSRWNAVALKYDSAGTCLWAYAYMTSSDFESKGQAMAVCRNGDILLAGQRNYAPSPDHRALLVRLNSSGDTLWTRTDSTSTYFPVAATADSAGNGYLVWCLGNVMRVAKYSRAGQRLWRAERGNPDSSYMPGYFAALGPDQGVFACGHMMFGGGSYMKYFAARYSPQGQELWLIDVQRADTLYDRPAAVVADGYGNLYMTGQGMFADPAVTELLTMKFRPSGAVEELGRAQGPRSPALTVRPSVVRRGCAFGLPAEGSCARVRVLDLAGRTLRVLAAPAGSSAITWDATDESGNRLPDGVYFALAEGPGFRSSCKFPLSP